MPTISIRYIVEDVEAAAEFYRDHLAFRVDRPPASGFAMLSRGDLRLLLNAPTSGGAGKAKRDSSPPAPGGWNRFQIEVDDLESTVKRLESAGVTFRTEIVSVGIGKQIVAEDPSRNPVELFELFDK